MAKYLSQEWLDEGRSWPRSSPSGPAPPPRMQFAVTGGARTAT